MRPFVPYDLPIDGLIKPMVFYNELISASTNLGKYQVMLKKSKVNEYFLITPFSLQETVQSSKIEGIQVTFDEVLEKDKLKYYRLLNGTRKEKDGWNEWIKFFFFFFNK